MKKFINLLVVVIVITLTASYASAVESIVWSVNGGGKGGGAIEVTSTNTCSASGTLTTTALKNGAGVELDLTGYLLYSVSIYYGATAPTANSDLELLEHSASGYDVLHGAGENQIDQVTNSSFKPWINGIESPMPIYGKLYQKVTQAAAATANAQFVIVYRFLKQ
jgi:hypothetical protein